MVMAERLRALAVAAETEVIPMSVWVMIVRGFDCDDKAALDAEQRIKTALPEHDLGFVTVPEWLYELYNNLGTNRRRGGDVTWGACTANNPGDTFWVEQVPAP